VLGAGNRCEYVRSCNSSSCSDRGNCSYDVGGAPVCLCEAGFTGAHCQLVDWCTYHQPCLNNASCLLNTTTGDYVCDCLPGSLGANCSMIDACWPADICENGGTCLSLPDGRYTCACVSGYTGLSCSVLVDACLSEPCWHDGTCVPVDGGFTCSCGEAFTGLTCETEMPCRSSPCQHGGTCHETDATSYVCDCPSGKLHYLDVLVNCTLINWAHSMVPSVTRCRCCWRCRCGH